MTDLVYMASVDAQYTRTFEATVVSAGADHAVLDRTAFYPTGGGQPSDRGTLTWDGGEATVTKVTKTEGVRHFLTGDVPPEGTTVTGEIDWDRRHKHMRMHTAQHLVSAVVHDLFGAETAGNQIHADHSRIDFARDGFTDDELATVEEEVAGIVDAEIPLEIHTAPRDEVEETIDADRVNLELIPDSVRELRMVRIGDVDVCPCAGTHVRNTGEIGRVRFTKTRSKGDERTRVVYELA